MLHITVKFMLATAVLLAAGHAAAAAGNFLLVTGGVQVVNAQGASRAATTGGTVDSGDTVMTQGGRTQIRFTDSGLVSLQPGTEFKLADYRFREAGGTGESAIFNLVKGSIRVITGIVGRRSRTDFLVNTPTATIGIRGTEFLATMCASSCAQADGLYVQTGEGVITVRNALGEVDVSRGQTAFVASANSSPQRTSAAPALNAVTVSGGPLDAPSVSGENVAVRVVGGGEYRTLIPTGTGEFQPGTILTTNPFGPVTPLTSAGLAVTASGSFTVNGVTYTDALDSGAGSGTGVPAGVIAGMYFNNGILNGFVLNRGNEFANLHFDKVFNAGSNADLYWGRWSQGTLSVFAGLNGTNDSKTQAVPATASLHYLMSTSVPTIPTAGSATFSFVGGTPSTNASGGLGSGITSGTVTANFATSMVNAAFAVVHGGTFNINTAMPMNSGNRAAFSSSNLGGSVSGASPGSTVTGFFAGTGAPTGAGLSYSLKTGFPQAVPGVSGTVTPGVVGVGAFR
ncbi:MAG: FecR family protein [Rhodoferax sp.]|nr:FecR family protein [Rhodoferax sp.]